MVCKERAEALIKFIVELCDNCFNSLFIIRISDAGNCSRGVLFFVTIMFDEVRLKVLCIHTKLITVCLRLQAVQKESFICLVCCSLSKNSKNVLFCSIYHDIT